MAERYLHDLTEEPTKTELDEKGTECLRSLTSYPTTSAELPPLPVWYIRWPVRLVKLFPCFLVCTLVTAVAGAMAGWGGDMVKGMEYGAVIGMVVGAFLDARLSMSGRMIDD